jgi:hypothetical protein
MSGVLPLLPVYTFMAWIGKNVTYVLSALFSRTFTIVTTTQCSEEFPKRRVVVVLCVVTVGKVIINKVDKTYVKKSFVKNLYD